MNKTWVKHLTRCLVLCLGLCLASCGFQLRKPPIFIIPIHIQSKVIGHTDFFNQLNRSIPSPVHPYSKLPKGYTLVIESIDSSMTLNQITVQDLKQYLLHFRVRYHVLGSHARCKETKIIDLTRLFYENQRQILVSQHQLPQWWHELAQEATQSLVSSLVSSCPAL